MTRTARLTRIEMLIRSRGHVSLQTLMQEMEISRATLKRDLEYLRDQLNAPIVYDRDLNGYRFDLTANGPRHEMPGLWFSESELHSLLVAHELFNALDSDGVLSRHLSPMIERIHQLLGTSEQDARALLKRVRIVSATRRPVPSRYFELVGHALMKRHRLHLRYLTRGRHETSERDVSPQRLMYYRNTWYLDAWCHVRERVLRFSLDSIEDATDLALPAKDMVLMEVEAEMDSGYGIYAGSTPHRAVLRFTPHAAQWVSREEWHPRQRGVTLADGGYQMEVPYTDPTELAMDVLRHGDQVTIASDTGGLAALVRERTRRAWEKYQEDGGARQVVPFSDGGVIPTTGEPFRVLPILSR